MQAGLTGDEVEQNLFAFRSASVTPLADGAYRSTGELVTSQGTTTPFDGWVS